MIDLTDGLIPAHRALHSAIVQAEGGYFTLADGRVLLDLTSQTLNLAFGQGHPAIKDAVIQQINKAQYASSKFGTLPFQKLSKILSNLAPSSITSVALKLTDGSDAVETALKIAMLHTRRQRVGCLPGAWHGETYLTLGLSSAHHGRIIAERAKVSFAPRPEICALTELVRMRDDMAAVIVDPALVSNGLPANSVNEDLGKLRHECDRSGTLLVFDEIQTFGGWLGESLFSTELNTVTPDMVCLGKALGAGYPLAAVLCRPDLAGLLQYNDAEFTYGGHPVSCAAALAGLATFLEMRGTLTERELGFASNLEEAFDASTFEVRRLGLIATVTLTNARLREVWVKRMIAGCLDEGILIRSNDFNQRILIKAPLVLAAGDLHSGICKVGLVAKSVLVGLSDSISIDMLPGSDGAKMILIRKPCRINKNLDYVAQLLRCFDESLTVETRSPSDQQDLSKKLVKMGVPATQMYAHLDAFAVEYDFIPGQSLQVILSDPKISQSVANALALRHYEAVTLAHDHGLIIGDRWPGNVIVTHRGEIQLIDFELGYAGPFLIASLLEEAFCIIQTVIAIHDDCINKSDILTRLVQSLLIRHGIQRTRWCFDRLSAFYLGMNRPLHANSTPFDAYKTVLELAKKVFC